MAVRLFPPAIVLATAAVVFAVFPGCSARSYRFSDVAPVTVSDDKRPGPVPDKTRYEKVQYLFDSFVRRRVVSGMRVSKGQRAMDVNSFDELPASTWYTPRLGHRSITPAELLAGPIHVGPPQHPITATRAKSGGGNPGFIVQDGRGERYLIKFDPPEFPGIETSTALIANRIFWGFGYNVPEDYLFFFDADDLHVDPAGELTTDDVQQVLDLVAPPIDGVYRATASLLLDGIAIGPTLAAGVRADDPNDLTPHERRRTLRALHVLAAFLHHTDIRIDNFLDVYVGPAGIGYVKHYLLDFGEALGGHGAEHGYLWDGYDNFFAFSDVATNVFTLGLNIRDWENIEYTRWKSVGAFESKVFDLQKWKTPQPYEPIVQSLSDDDYWAAKVLGGLTRSHVEALVKAAQYPETGAGEYVIKTLMERRLKVLRSALGRVSPVDVVDVSDNTLRLKDMGRSLLPDISLQTRYDILFYDGGGKLIESTHRSAAGSDEFVIPLDAPLIEASHGYLRVDVWVSRDEKKAPTAAEFHLQTASLPPRLVGVVH